MVKFLQNLILKFKKFKNRFSAIYGEFFDKFEDILDIRDGYGYIKILLKYAIFPVWEILVYYTTWFYSWFYSRVVYFFLYRVLIILLNFIYSIIYWINLVFEWGLHHWWWLALVFILILIVI